MLLADWVIGGDLARPVVVVDDGGTLDVPTDEVLVERVGDLEEPIGERRVVDGHVPKGIAVPVRVNRTSNRGDLPLLERHHDLGSTIHVEFVHVGDKAGCQSQNSGPHLSAYSRAGCAWSFSANGIAHSFPRGISVAYLFGEMSAPECDDFGTQRVPVLHVDVRDDMAFASENWSACPSGSLLIPHRVEVECGVGPCCLVDGDVPLARGILVVIVEVGHGGTIEIVVSFAGNGAPSPELGWLQSRALAVPNEVLRVAGRAGIATPIVYIAPIVEFRRVDAQKVVRREELAAKGTVEGLLVLGMVVLGREEAEVIQEAFVALLAVLLDDLGLVARERVAVGVDGLPSQVASPDLKELIAVGVGELCSQSC